MAVEDDTVPESYPYLWNSDSSISVIDFLTKYKPSMVQDDGTKPWLWVQKSPLAENVDAESTATEEAAEYCKIPLYHGKIRAGIHGVSVKEVTEKIESIKNDASIPIRANKKKGIKSKKELREELQLEATKKLKEISVKHKHVSGKWLIFAPPDKVDIIWASLGASLIEGPLSGTCTTLAKVSTCPKNETPNYQHVMCLYMPDVYDRNNVTEVMKILLRKHGLNLMGVKSNLYTSIGGLDSKHPSGVQSTVWRNSSLLPDAEVKKLKDDFYADLNSAKSPNEDEHTESSHTLTTPATTASKPKPKLKKKADEDPYASDKDEVQPDPTMETENPIKPTKRLKNYTQDDFESEDDKDEEEEQRKRELKAKKVVSAANKVAYNKRPRDEDENDEELPRKRVGRK